MPLHLIKMSVGATEVDDIRRWQRERLTSRGGRAVVPGYTRRMPRRREEILDGGSIYWIFKGAVRCRQRVLDLVEQTDDEGLAFCRMILDPTLVETDLQPRRPMQGWRYLTAADAPPDLDGIAAGNALPPHLAQELRALGLL